MDHTMDHKELRLDKGLVLHWENQKGNIAVVDFYFSISSSYKTGEESSNFSTLDKI